MIKSEIVVGDFMKSRGLKVLHQNVRGLLINFHLVQKFFATHEHIDIMGVTEVHTTKDVSDRLFDIPNYSFISKPRIKGKGGGVGIYVREVLDWKRRLEFENESTECLWIEIFFKNTKSFLVSIYYRPPNSSKHLSKNFNEKFNDSLIAAQREQKEILILGDFNANYLDARDNKELKTIINLNGFRQLIEKPTRITSTSKSLIDIILTNNTDNIKNTIIAPLSIGDHELVGCVRKLHCKKYTSKTTYARDYKNYEPAKVIFEVKKVNWGSLYSCKNVELAATIFTTTLKNIFDKHAPYKTKVIKEKPAPWLKADLRKLMDKRDKALRKARKTKLLVHFEIFKKLRNKCNGKLKEAKRKYHRNLINDNKGNPRKFWKAVKTVFPSKPNKKNFSNQLSKSENEKNVNTFSHYFGNVVKQLKSNASLITDYVWRKMPIFKRTNQIFRFSYVSKVFVEKQLKTLHRHKSTGLDELPPGIIKDCAAEISKPLTFIINLSIISGKVPSLWKEAKIVPIHKGGDKKPENYRPISILPIFSKILERAVKNQLSDFLEKNKLLTNSQFGYRQERSTKLASTFVFDDIRKHIDNGQMVGAVYIDLTKAFDTVGHGILLNKLQEYGVGGRELEWFTNYLFNRNQVVCIDNTTSTKQQCTSGVPQGSIIGPLLFILFFNDFPECLKHSNVTMYADDTVVYVNGKEKTEIDKLLNEELERIARYFDDNELFINLKKGKTEAMLFGTAKRLQTTNKELEISFKGQRINNVSEYKYLGNIVDRHLNFNINFEKVYKKASGRLKLLKNLRYYLTQEAAYKVYTLMIVPMLTYRGQVKLSYTNTQNKRINSFERRASEIIGRAVPSIINSIKKEALVFVKKSLENVTCNNFSGYFKIRQHTKSTRNQGYFVELPKVKLEIGKQSFKYCGAKLYNDLPLTIRKAESLDLFKREVKAFFEIE